MTADGGTIADLAPGEFARRVAGDGLGVRIGPFDIRLQARVPGMAPALYRLYRAYPLLDDDRVFSAHVSIRGVWRPAMRPARRVRFSVDGRVPHEDMPRAHGLAVLEWGLNLVVSLRFHRYLILHAAVVERDGRTLVLPALPGHGKTTLCAALAHRGWRLLSDEFGLLCPGSTTFVPLPRPMPIKNESIALLRAFAPDAEWGPTIPGTIKGTVAHLCPPASSVTRAAVRAPAAWVVFPRWAVGASLSLQPVDRPEAFMSLATNAFNYEIHGEAGFDTLRSLVETTRCFRLTYSGLSEAVAAIDALADGAR